MKKIAIAGLLGLCVLAFLPAESFARHWKHDPPRRTVTMSLFVFHPWSVGYRHLIARNVYLTGNMDYLDSDKDLRFQAGAVYRIPHKILFFHVFGGGGVEASRNEGFMYPYVSAGANFWILYTEINHPLRNGREPVTRFGFSFSF